MAALTPKASFFTIKAHRSLTYDQRPDWPRAAAEFARALRARAFRERLGGCPAAVPSPFRYRDPNRLYLGERSQGINRIPYAPVISEARSGLIRPCSEMPRSGCIRPFIGDGSVPEMPCPRRDLPLAGRRPTCGSTAEAPTPGSRKAKMRAAIIPTRTLNYAEWVGDNKPPRKARRRRLRVAFGNHAGGNAVRDARPLKALLDAELAPGMLWRSAMKLNAVQGPRAEAVGLMPDSRIPGRTSRPWPARSAPCRPAAGTAAASVVDHLAAVPAEWSTPPEMTP
jgi:hypothetical protein